MTRSLRPLDHAGVLPGEIFKRQSGAGRSPIGDRPAASDLSVFADEDPACRWREGAEGSGIVFTRCHDPAKAGHPVRRGHRDRQQPSRSTGSPAFAVMTEHVRGGSASFITASQIAGSCRRYSCRPAQSRSAQARGAAFAPVRYLDLLSRVQSSFAPPQFSGLIPVFDARFRHRRLRQSLDLLGWPVTLGCRHLPGSMRYQPGWSPPYRRRWRPPP